VATIHGTETDDELEGTAVGDTIYGHGGNDVIDGRGGQDRMEGGTGDDTYIVDTAADTVVEQAGEGFDTVRTTISAYALTAHVERLYYFGPSTASFRGTGNALGNYIEGGAGDDFLDGGEGADTLVGLGGNDTYYVDHAGDVVVEAVGGGAWDSVRTTLSAYTLPTNVEWLFYAGPAGVGFTGTGNAQNNLLVGGSGNDVLDGGGGGDQMKGGLGDDSYFAEHDGDYVEEYAGEGIDSVYTTRTSFVLWDNVEKVYFTGPAGTTFFASGNGLDNHLEGGSGSDVLAGYGGNDTLVGRQGDDTYFVENAGDVVVEAANEGHDSVISALTSYTLGANVERLAYNGTVGAAFFGTGNSLDNIIEGGSGNDTLNGMAGADAMYGYGGDDTYHVDHQNDYVEEGIGGGTDRVVTTLGGYTLGANVEQLVYAGPGNIGFQGYGNELANFIQGGAGDDVLNGRGGADTLVGLGGDDTYEIDNSADAVVEAAGGGTDWVIATGLAHYTLGAHVENFAFLGTTAVSVYGNALANVLMGDAGNDTLNGMGGADQMYGGAGNDYYFVDKVATGSESGDLVVEYANSGKDTVYASVVSYVLPDHVEDLINNNAPGVAFFGWGNALNNVIQGGDANDELNGGGGADILYGMKGDDIYFVDNSGDYTGEYAGEGTDTVIVQTLTAWTLRPNVENLEYWGGANFTGIGNDLANRITGGDSNDMLDGRGGADTLVGGLGNDIYFVDDAGDSVVEKAGEGIDIVNAYLSAHTLAANVENLVYQGAYGVAFTAIGNALDNMIEAGEGNDYIDGGAGADRMTGRNGNDTYIVDNLGDVVIEHSLGGIDEVRTSIGSRSDYSQMYTLPAHVENLTGTSSAAQGVYGNALDNVIKMGPGGDLVVLHDGGVDTVESGGGNDFIYFGSTLTAADKANGGAGFDTVGLIGHYHELVLGEASLVSIEKLAVYGSGPNAVPFNYDITTVDANVAGRGNLMVVGLSLSAAEKLTFNGSAETDGSFNIRGGKGADILTGGAGNDQIYGNLGADRLRGGAGDDQFEYNSVSESTFHARDEILDFTLGDKINLWNIDADGNAANGNGRFAFIGSTAFGGTAGQVRTQQLEGGWLVEADVNGDALADMSIIVHTSPGHILSATDFVL
jgi:Ca2+-binding RTX toxin-like protein